jgi:DegV family protein with EDD domain
VTVGLVTDSNSQLPPELAERYGVDVVPLTVTVDGEDFLEGVDLDADAFYARFRSGTPSVATSQPSPGRFAETYARVAARGVEAILSVHLGAAVSGTVNSARLAAAGAAVPVRVVDTGTASFGVSCCLWEAAEALRAGGSVEEAASLAEELAVTVGNVFVVRALDLARAGGRLAAGVEAPAESIPVLSLVAGEIKSVGAAADVDEAATVMADYALLAGQRLRVAVGIADAGAAPLWHALEDRLSAADEVLEVVRYRVGPSVGAHTGPGTAGAFFYPSL